MLKSARRKNRSIYKHSKSGIWWIDFRTPHGERIRRSAKTRNKQEAQHYHDKLKHEAWHTQMVDKKPERLVEEALAMLLRESMGQKDIETKIRHVKYWREKLGGRYLSSLTSDDIRNNLPDTDLRTNNSLSNATQNRYRTTINRALSLAKKAGWIESTPYTEKLQEPKVRVRWLTHYEASSLIKNLKTQVMKDICFFALTTGARMTEILTLTWNKIDFERRIAIVTSDIAKSGKARPLPLNKDAILFLLKKKREKTCPYVFHKDNGKPLVSINRKDFKRSLSVSGINDFRFHDLRHTWASWHVQKGTPLLVLKELGGWETLEMVQKYAHLNANHLLDYVDKLGSVGTFWEQS